jgi:hypothetical protein
MQFVEWLQNKEAQTIIRDFGKDKYGELLVFPHSPEGRKLQSNRDERMARTGTHASNAPRIFRKRFVLSFTANRKPNSEARPSSAGAL